MVKITLIFLISIFCLSNVASQEKKLWWLQTSSNKKYEDNYRYAISEIKNGILKREIDKFIKSYIDYTTKSKEEVAVEVTLLPQEKLGEQNYNITYLTDYYNSIETGNNIQQIAIVNDRIVFIKVLGLNNISIKKEILHGLLRDRFKKEAKNLNKQYEELKKEGGGVPFSFNLEHEIPNWNLVIRNGKLIKKEVYLD